MRLETKLEELTVAWNADFPEQYISYGFASYCEEALLDWIRDRLEFDESD